MAVRAERSAIVVVTGLPRSGTSMVMRMLGAGGAPLLTDDTRPPDPDNPAGFFEFEPVKRLKSDAGFLAGAAGHAVKVVAPLLFSLPAYYAYRVIFVERALDEVMASQRAMLERAEGGAAVDTDVVKARSSADADARLTHAFQGILDRLRSWMVSQPNVSGLCLDHASAISDPGAAAHRIGEFLADMEWAVSDGSEGRAPEGTKLDHVAMAAVVDARLHRQRR